MRFRRRLIEVDYDNDEAEQLYLDQLLDDFWNMLCVFAVSVFDSRDIQECDFTL